ncbi:hypothetical protein XENOCAPTIV_027592 [Xenoophorus captivus]|uniref:Rootletin-like coiled-coil domain-containing protein n=1 Tax=Xenoophorus captivus TaxID=1517983 RepID=A0ABV0RVG4_9TELE
MSMSSSLSAVNAMLREQLEQVGLANEALSQDIRRLTVDWTKAREELEQKESDWRREEEVSCSGLSTSVDSRVVGEKALRVQLEQQLRERVTVLSDGESSSEADQDSLAAPLLALIRDSSPRRSSSSLKLAALPEASLLSPLPDAALSALRSAVTNKTLQLQVTCYC